MAVAASGGPGVAGEEPTGSKTGVAQGAQNDQEFRKLAEVELPRAANAFVAGVESLCSAASGDVAKRLAKGDERLPQATEMARRFEQMAAHLREVAWRSAFTPAQAEMVGRRVAVTMPLIRTAIEAVAALNFRAMVEAGQSAEAFIAACDFGIEVSRIYLHLVSMYGAPRSLMIEEIGVAVIACFKQCVKQLAAPLLSLATEGNSSEQAAAAALQQHADAGRNCLANLASLMHDVSQYLCRNRYEDEHLHQIVNVAVGCYFFSEPDIQLLAGAGELLVTIFARHEALRPSILQDFFVKVPKLPSGKRAKKFHLPVSQDSCDHGLSTWTHLLLRLVQSCSLPLHEQLGSEVHFDAVLAARTSAQTVLAQLTGGLMQRLLLTRTKDEELRAVFDDIVEEVLSAAFKPAWPAATAWIRTILQHLIGIIQPDKKKQLVEASVREFALRLMGKIVAQLSSHHVEMSKSRIVLPRWDEDPDKVPQEERLLQHIALRVSLDMGGSMPWTEAARAVQAWDAELFLKHCDDDCSGLSSFTDEIAFRYLALAHVEDERYVHARLPPVQQDAAAGAPVSSEALSACVLPAGHPVHAWSFLVCDWAEAVARRQKPKGDDARRRPRRGASRAGGGDEEEGHGFHDAETHWAVIERFLSLAWTSRVPLDCEGTSWRSGGGRRVLLPWTVSRVYRQLRSVELEGLRRAAIDCVVLQANSPQASLRKTAMRGLSDIIDADSSILESKPVEETIEMRLQDESSWVRQVSLDLLGRILEGSLDMSLESGDWTAQPAVPSSNGRAGSKGQQDEPSGRNAAASAMLLRFHGTVRGRINDTSVLVRRQASKMLSAFVLNHPDHPDVDEVALDLLRRSSDSEILRNLVVGTFELLWFADDEPTPTQAQQLSRVVDASKSLSVGPADILSELLSRFQKSMSNRKHGRGFEDAMRRWIAVLLHEFVQFNIGTDVPTRRVARKSSGEMVEKSASKVQEAWVQRRSLLSTLEAFAVARPRELLAHLRPLTVYLALEDDAAPEEQWVAMKVCQILASVLPYGADRRGLMDHRQVQVDLQVLIKNQPSSGVHEAVRCLCVVVKYVTGDLNQLLVHLNNAIPALTHLCELGEGRPGTLQRIQQMYMSRQSWILASVLESLAIDDYIEKVDGPPSSSRRIPRSSLRFQLVGGSVASTVADILMRLYALGETQLRAVVVTCLGFFLRGNRSFVKERRISEIFADALSAPDLGLRLKVLETLASLLMYFGRQADQETKTSKGNVDGSIAGSAVESAQPLAVYSDAVLTHVTFMGSGGGALGDMANGKTDVGVEGATNGDTLTRIRAEALSVVRQLNQQGLVNPMAVLPKVFASCFVPDVALSEPAGAMMKDMLELRPTLLLNRFDEAFREAFQAAMLLGPSGRQVRGPPELHLTPQQVTPASEVYAERFRKQKGTREAFLRKALREVFRVQADRFKEHFSELLTKFAPNGVGKENSAGMSTAVSPLAKRGRPKRLRRIQVIEDDTEEPDSLAVAAGSGPDELAGLSAVGRCQVLYTQFAATTISAMPFSYESEPLLVIFECNRHLALHAGSLAANFEDAAAADVAAGGSDVEEVETPRKQKRKDAAQFDKGTNKNGDLEGVDAFGESLSILACIVLKRTMKAEYSLSAEQCAQFNPKDIKQERLKAFFPQQFLASRTAASSSAPAAGADGEAVVGTTRLRFPVEEWRRLLTPLVKNEKNPIALAAYIRSLLDDDPWETCSRRSQAVPRRKDPSQEPQRKKRAAAASPTASRAPAQDDDISQPPKRKKRAAAASPASRRPQARDDEDSEEDWEPKGPSKRGRGVGRGRGRRRG